MTSNSINNVPYLRATRNFPSDIPGLVREVNKAYLDTATAMNLRTVGIFPSNTSAVTGESWYISPADTTSKQQTLRQVYTFTVSGNIAHGLNTSQLSNFTKIYGTIYNGTNWYPLPYVDVADVTNQINVYVSPTNIVITSGAGSPPSIVSGLVVLEWMATT